MSEICWSVYQVVKKNNDKGIKWNKKFIIMQISQMSRLLVSEWDGKREGEKERERKKTWIFHFHKWRLLSTLQNRYSGFKQDNPSFLFQISQIFILPYWLNCTFLHSSFLHISFYSLLFLLFSPLRNLCQVFDCLIWFKKLF